MRKQINLKRQTFLQAGFSAFELIGVLAVMTFLILAVNRIVNNINKTKEYNQMADQAKSFSQKSAKQIEDDYRNLVTRLQGGNDIVLQGTSYMPEDLSAFSRYKQKPCIYVTGEAHNQLVSSLQAYVIFGNTCVTASKLNRADLAAIAHNVGGNAGILVNTQGHYKFTGSVHNNQEISVAAINKIIAECGFVRPMPAYSLMIDISKSKALFSALKGSIDRQTTSTEDDPALNKSSQAGQKLSTMQTNIYLDYVYKESSSDTSYYCLSAAKLSLSDANNLCQSSANSGNKVMYGGSASWSSVVEDNKQCIATATAHFYQAWTEYSCAEINMGYAANYCPAALGNAIIMQNTGRWGVIQRSGGQCIANAYADYQSFTCDYQCIPWNSHDLYNCPPLNELCNTRQGWWPRGVSSPDRYNAQLSGKECSVEFWCSNNADNYSRVKNKLPARVENKFTHDCGQGRVNAFASYKENDLGFGSCGSKVYQLQSLTTVKPAKHTYKALDYGKGNSSGQRIQLKADAPGGEAVKTSQLNVTNAGLQAGYFAPTSHMISPGTKCNSVEVGKIAQDLSGGIQGLIASQLQCMYNPIFCGQDNYCYLPVKNVSFTYQYSQLRQSGGCPDGTMVDSGQPMDGIDASVNCKAITGQDTTLTGVGINCYQNSFNISFCQGYQSVCANSQVRIPVNALRKLRCTNSTTTFTVDNYQP